MSNRSYADLWAGVELHTAMDGLAREVADWARERDTKTASSTETRRETGR